MVGIDEGEVGGRDEAIVRALGPFLSHFSRVQEEALQKEQSAHHESDAGCDDAAYEDEHRLRHQHERHGHRALE